jgi:hypothetical protein
VFNVPQEGALVDNISRIQQFLAESKFVEAQKEAELVLGQSRSSESIELLELYFESLKAQSLPLPPNLLFTLIEKLLVENPDQAEEWLGSISQEKIQDKQRLLIAQIKIADQKGKTEDLYNLISQYQIMKYEMQSPNIPAYVQGVVGKYFPHDFHLQLQYLAIELMRMDLTSCEKLIKELILSCYEKSSPRGIREKLNSLYQVLSSTPDLKYLEIYKNFISLMVNGVEEKKDFKKITEIIIFTEDFKLQALILNLLLKQGLDEVARDLAQEMRQNKDYNYVYLDKYLPHLKSFFYQAAVKSLKPLAPLLKDSDLKLDKASPYHPAEEVATEVSEEEELLSQLLKHQSFSSKELLDIAVSFVQAEFFRAALKAAEMAFNLTEEAEVRLKANYLKVTCLLKTGDFRAALDVSLGSLSYSITQNDILSFLYSQAEAHLKLKEYKNAKKILKQILTIDANYRMTKERLERLDAI